jgi:hypothetical protein
MYFDRADEPLVACSGSVVISDDWNALGDMVAGSGSGSGGGGG